MNWTETVILLSVYVADGVKEVANIFWKLPPIARLGLSTVVLPGPNVEAIVPARTDGTAKQAAATNRALYRAA
jgi:hypothetical protein